MRSLLPFLVLLSVALARAESLYLPADTAMVVTVDGKYDPKYSNSIRERFIVRNAIGGGDSQAVVIEKFAPGKHGSEDKVIAARNFSISELPGIKEHLSDISKKSAEATYGCCNIEKIQRSGDSWTFRAKYGKSSFHCKTKETPQNELTISCSK